MAPRKPSSTPRRTRKAASIQPVQPSAFDNPVSAPLDVEAEIRRRAYEIYLERGSTPGNESEDWLLAEREVRARGAAAGHSA